jgi:hypothetical protein
MKRGAPYHPKMRALARILGMPLPWVVGSFEMLLHFTAQYAPRGDLGRYSNDELAEAGGWPAERRAAEYVQGLEAARFVDRSEAHRYIMHDWSEHADDAVHKQLKRKGLLFADGAAPYARNKARGVADPAEPEPALSPVETSRDMSRQFASVACLPEPEPEPEPEPSGGGSVRGTESAAPPPPNDQAASDLAQLADAMHSAMPRGSLPPDRPMVEDVLRKAGSIEAALMICAHLAARRDRPRSYALFATVAAAPRAPRRPPSVLEMRQRSECAECGGLGFTAPEPPPGLSASDRCDWMLDRRQPCACQAKKAATA